MTAELRAQAEAERAVVIGSTTLVQLLDRLDALEKVAEAARAFTDATPRSDTALLQYLENHPEWPDDDGVEVTGVTAGQCRALDAAFAELSKVRA